MFDTSGELEDEMSGFMEIIDGIIIGQITHPFRFYSRDGELIVPRSSFLFFENGEDAIEWFREHYPDEYAEQVEMRQYDD